jgi:3-demethylubiquinone-9 3-methyltransferase
MTWRNRQRTRFVFGTTATPRRRLGFTPRPSPIRRSGGCTAHRENFCLGLNGGPEFKHTEAFSFQVATADQAETDRYWNAIVGNGGQESACGWCKDKWGLSWQITPIVLTKAVTDPDPAAAKRAFEAMMQMRKIDIAAIEAARRG